MLVDVGNKEINCKIVFYGPALSGKTTNLKYIFKKLNPAYRGDMITIDTKGERTLFFDFLPVEVKLPGGFKVRFHLYTVPGQFFYKASRRLVLRGADGLVFVVDSSEARMQSNLEILEEMVSALRDHGQNVPDPIPLVMQYNKRDLPDALPVPELEAKLNRWGVPYVEAVAINGVGVFQTLDLITKLVLKKVIQKAKVGK